MAKRAKRKTGRRTKCTAALTEQIAEVLEKGHFITVACASVGISESAYHKWADRGRREMVRLEGRGTRPRKDERPFVQFVERCTGAQARAEDRALGIIWDAMGKNNLQAAMWYLERAHGSRWGKRTVDLNVKGGPVVHIFMPEEDG